MQLNDNPRLLIADTCGNHNQETKYNIVAPPGFCNRGGVRYGSVGGLEYEVPQSRLYCLCINVALCSTALQCICRVIRRSSMTMKAHTYYIIFGRPPIGGSFPLPPWRRHWYNTQIYSTGTQGTKIVSTPRTTYETSRYPHGVTTTVDWSRPVL